MDARRSGESGSNEHRQVRVRGYQRSEMTLLRYCSMDNKKTHTHEGIENDAEHVPKKEQQESRLLLSIQGTLA
jgi:hypothetical protein